MSTSQSVVGASDHYGRAELVTFGLRGGAPVLLDRRRVDLIDEGLPIAPYHHEALEMGLAEAADLVDRVRRSVAKCARAAMEALLETHPVRALVLQASPYERLPDSLEDVLGSRALTNAADGMLYREALADAATGLGLEVRRVPRRTDPTALAAEAMAVDRSVVDSRIAEFGRAAGPPWRKDHKWAAAAALGALAPRIRR